MRTWTLALIVARRELLESLREVHVLVFSLGFPLLFYPLIFYGGIQLALLEEGIAEQNPPRVVVTGPADLVEGLDVAPFELVAGPPSAEDLARGDVDLLIHGEEQGEAVAIDVRYTSIRPRSSENRALVEERFDVLRETRQAALEAERDLPEGALSQWSVAREDVAPPGRTVANLLGMAVPMILLVSMMLSGVYPTVEVVVGERERGTLETTLLASCSRVALVAGKVLAVVGLLMLSVAGNAVAMGLTVLSIMEQLDPDSDGGVALEWLDLVAAAPLLLLTAILTAAVMTLAALPTRSFRQGQSAVSTVSTVLMIPAMVGVMPEIDLTLATAAIPVANCVLVLREAIGGDGILWGPMGVALGVNGLAAGATLLAAGRVVSSEGWLFGGAVPRWLRWLQREEG